MNVNKLLIELMLLGKIDYKYNNIIKSLNKIIDKDIDEDTKNIIYNLLYVVINEEIYVEHLENNKDNIIDFLIKNNITIDQIIGRWNIILENKDSIIKAVDILDKDLIHYIYNVINRYITISNFIISKFKYNLNKETELLAIFNKVSNSSKDSKTEDKTNSSKIEEFNIITEELVTIIKEVINKNK